MRAPIETSWQLIGEKIAEIRPESTGFDVKIGTECIDKNRIVADWCVSYVGDVDIRAVMLKESKTIEVRDIVLAIESNKRGKIRKLNGLPLLWEFTLDMLNERRYAEIIEWQESNHFKIKQPEVFATLWGWLSQNDKMDYAKMTRSYRYYASAENGII